MNILVIGGAGYIGVRLVSELYRLGFCVDVIDLLWFGNFLNKNVNIINRNAEELTIGDLKKYEQIIF